MAKCEHGRRRSQCKECGGSSICQHGRRRSGCKDCGGSGICQHGRSRSYCMECGGSSICQHGRSRSTCKECGGASICQHGNRCFRCKECKEPAARKRKRSNSSSLVTSQDSTATKLIAALGEALKVVKQPTDHPFMQMLETAHKQLSNDETVCPICLEDIHALSHVAACGHVVCLACFNNQLKHLGDDRCSLCRKGTVGLELQFNMVQTGKGYKMNKQRWEGMCKQLPIGMDTFLNFLDYESRPGHIPIRQGRGRA